MQTAKPKKTHCLRLLIAITLFLFLASSCTLGPPALNDAVLGYDETTASLELKLILLNIARRDQGNPIHFTVASSIAASYNWNANASVGTEGRKSAEDFWSNTFNFNLGVSGSENPTFSIYPVTGEEYTQRLLTPLTESLFNTLIFQDQDIVEIIRLLANGIEVQDPVDGSFVRMIENTPRIPDEYTEFRQLAMHLQSLQDRRQLFVRTLIFEEPLVENFPEEPGPGYMMQAINYDLSWREQFDGNYTLSRRKSGRLVISNYDPRKLSDRQRFELNERIKNNPEGFVFIDIAPDGPGGDLPIYGAIQLRSMIQILDFIAAGIERYPEFDVEKYPGTVEISTNPVKTLNIVKSTEKPSPKIASVFYGGHYYSVDQTEWDLGNFRVLAWIFQASVGEIRSPGIPITIAK